MRKQVIALVVLSIFMSVVQVKYAFAGAWTVPKHHVWGEYYMKWDWAKAAIGPDGHRRTSPNQADSFRSWEFVMEPKMEFGVTDWLTALGSIEYKEGHYKEYDRPDAWDNGAFARKNNGVTNIKLGGRLRFIKEPVVVSTQTKVFIYPGYGNYHGEGGSFPHQPSIGYGDDAVEQRILIGKTFKIPIPMTKGFKLPAYVGAETGYRWRTRSVCGDIPYFVEAGVWPVEWFLIKTEIDGYKTNPGTGSIKESYGIWRIGGIWQVFGGDSILRQGNKMFNIEFDYGMTLWGKNTTAFEEWTVKIDTQF